MCVSTNYLSLPINYLLITSRYLVTVPAGTNLIPDIIMIILCSWVITVMLLAGNVVDDRFI